MPVENQKEKTAVNEMPEQQSEEQSVVPAADSGSKPAVTKPEPKKAAPQPAEKAAGGKQCTAIIGMFKDAENIARLKKLLQNNGFGVYATPGKNGAESIGATFNYSTDTEYQSRLNKLKLITGEQNLRIKK